MIPRKSERRARERVPYLCEVECTDFGPGRLRISDLSAVGAFIDTMMFVRIGARLRLQFKIKGVDIRVMAEVRHCVPQIGIGVQFLNLGPLEQNLINRALNELHAQQQAA
jgi:hypothetical protein